MLDYFKVDQLCCLFIKKKPFLYFPLRFNCGMTYYALSWAISDLGSDMYTSFLWGTLIELPAGIVSYILLNQYVVSFIDFTHLSIFYHQQYWTLKTTYTLSI